MSRDGRVRVIEGPAPEHVPETVEGFLRWLGAPSVLRLRGEDPSTIRAVSTLIHGNEPSGTRAVHRWLRSGRRPAVDVLVFIASVEAALIPPGFAHRCLPGGCDLNRCFVPPCDGREAELAAGAVELLREARPEALVDLHNTTGSTPPYGIGPAPMPLLLGLTALFARSYLDRGRLRLGSLVEATETVCSSLVVECGRRGDPAADRVAVMGIEQYMARKNILEIDENSTVSVFEDPVRIELRPGIRVRFASTPVPDADLTLLPDLDRYNLGGVPAGAPLGWLGPEGIWPFLPPKLEGEDRSRDLLEVRDGRVRARRAFTPLMMTTDPAAAMGDCLFYEVRPRGHPANGSFVGAGGATTRRKGREPR